MKATMTSWREKLYLSEEKLSWDLNLQFIMSVYEARPSGKAIMKLVQKK